MRTFQDVFGFAPAAQADAPGRVNLLGEHTDYNDGFVLPAAIPQSTHVEIAPSRDERFHFYSVNFEAGVAHTEAEVSYPGGAEAPAGYALYIDGCIRMMRDRGVAIGPLCVHVRSTVPMGSGLSSSAALEVAVLRALRKLYLIAIDDVEIARAAQAAEIRYVGVRCGIMDQMASSLADREHLLFLDTRSLQTKLLPFPPLSEVLAIDSGVPRTLAGSGYNQRRSECEAAARMLGVAALRDITDPQATERLPEPLNRRARHVVTEDNRVLSAVKGVDARQFGRLMNASHASLRDDYEVSVPALDELVALLQDHPAVYGARLTGAGFGGACVALVKSGSTAQVKEQVLAAYAARGFQGKALM